MQQDGILLNGASPSKQVQPPSQSNAAEAQLVCTRQWHLSRSLFYTYFEISMMDRLLGARLKPVPPSGVCNQLFQDHQLMPMSAPARAGQAPCPCSKPALPAPPAASEKGRGHGEQKLCLRHRLLLRAQGRGCGDSLAPPTLSFGLQQAWDCPSSRSYSTVLHMGCTRGYGHL